MRLSLFFLLLTLLPIETSAQISATTENGRRVLLHEDGTWSYAETRSEGEGKTGTTYLQTDSGQRMKAGIREHVSDEIELQIALEDGAPRLVMWKEKGQSCGGQLSSLEFGEASLLLRGAETIRLIDRGRTGEQTVTRSTETADLGIETETSYCQSWGIYHLTSREIQKLREHPLSKVRVRWDYDSDGWSSREGNEIISVDDNRWTLQRQIKALGL